MLLISYFVFQSSFVQTYLIRQIAGRLSDSLNTRIHIERVDIGFFDKLILNEVLIEDQKQDTLLYVDQLVASIDTLSLKKQKVVLSSLDLQKTKVFLSLDEKHFPNYKFLLDSLRSSDQESKEWDFLCRNFIFSETQLAYSYYKMEKPKLIDLRDINLDVSDLILSDDSIFFNINQLSLDDQKSFILNELSTQFTSKEHVIKLDKLKVGTQKSKIVDANFLFDQTPILEGKDFSYSEIDLDLKESFIHLTDVAQLIPALKGMDMEAKLAGRIYGTITDLKARNLELSFGNHTRLNCNFYINGLPNLDKTYISLDLNNSSTHFSDLMAVRLPTSLGGGYAEFPDFLKEAGIIRYQGNFTGFLSDFVAFGTVDSDFGRLTTDLAFLPSGDEELSVNGNLKTVNFKLGDFAGMEKMEEITFNGKIDGSYFTKLHEFSATIDGVIDSLVYNDYKFKNLILDGRIQEEKFEGDLSVNDPNLEAVFAGKLDFNPEFPVFDFELLLERANLVALNLDHIHKRSDLAIDLKAQFTGNSIDNLNGNIWFEEGIYSNENSAFNLKSLTIHTFKDSLTNLVLQSDFINANVHGDYSFRSLRQSIYNLIWNYIPSSGIKHNETLKKNAFGFSADIKNIEPITRTFIPELYIAPSKIEGHLNETNSTLALKANFPRIEYKNLIFNNYHLSLHANDEMEIKNRLQELVFNEDQKIYNLSFLVNAVNNHLNSRLTWNNFHEKTYSGELHTQAIFENKEGTPPYINIDILPSKIYVSDTLWTVNPAKIVIDSSRIEVDKFMISNGDQFLAFEGALSEDKRDRLNMSVNDFNLSNFNLITDKSINLKGILSGSASVFDVYEKALFLSDLRIDELSYRNQKIGDLSILSKWDRNSEAIQSELMVNDNERQSLYAYGSYTPGTDSLDFEVLFNHFPLVVLEPILEKSFKNIHGNATGDSKIYGRPGKMLIDAELFGLNAGLTLKNLQVGYYFNDTVRFSADSIIFDHIEIRDFEGNTGVFDGFIRHDNFSNMDYNLNLSSPKIIAINTTIRDNERFYGKVYADGMMKLTGHAKTIFLDVAASSLSGTSVNIALDYDEEVPVYDFIRFVNNEEIDRTADIRKNEFNQGKLTMNFDLDITPDAKIQLIYNSRIGDVIRAEGSGNMQIDIDPDFNISMFGNYLVDRGDYLFTLQNVINKKFEIERGGTMSWNGDPYNAHIDINAIYRLKASLYELFANTYEDVDYTQRIPVLCKIALTGNLNNPNIGFDIEFPSAEDRIRDEVRQFFNTDEDMNRQILSLLVLGRFYTPEYLRGTYEASNSNIVGTTASEMFSNQLSNWLSQISNDFDIGINYRPGNQITNDEIEFALSTQIFNDRVTINGNIGNNGTQANTANNNNIVGDFDLNVKLTNNGKLQFKAYNHSNNNIIYETSPYTQGIGFSYRENYDNFGELWQKFIQLFKKKER